jgi:hypothetical protein
MTNLREAGMQKLPKRSVKTRPTSIAPKRRIVAVTFDDERDFHWERWRRHFVALLKNLGWREGDAVTWAERTLELTPYGDRLPKVPGLARLRHSKELWSLIRAVTRDRSVPRRKRIQEIKRRARIEKIRLNMDDRTLRRLVDDIVGKRPGRKSQR